MRIAITGGSGFLGRHLARTLAARGHFPTVVARGLGARGEALRKEANINFMPLMMSDERRLFQAFNNCDAIVHLIGINREQEPNEFKTVHVENMIRVMTAARKAGIPRLIYVSYLKARPDIFSKYLSTKFEAEELLRHSELDWTIFRPGMIFGPGDHMISNISRALDALPIFSPPLSFGSNKIRPVALEDMTELIIAAAVDGRMVHKTVSVLGPEEMTLGDAVQRIARVKKKAALVLPLPGLLHLGMAAVMEKLTANPLVTVAQIQMLSDDMSTPAKGTDLPDDDLQPKTYLTEEVIRAALDTQC